jgi:hypothetical protein
LRDYFSRRREEFTPFFASLRRCVNISREGAKTRRVYALLCVFAALREYFSRRREDAKSLRPSLRLCGVALVFLAKARRRKEFTPFFASLRRCVSISREGAKTQRIYALLCVFAALREYFSRRCEVSITTPFAFSRFRAFV